MTIRYISDTDGLAAMESSLGGARRIALDCEAAGYHRYSDRVCLIQLTAGDETFLVDPLAVDPGAALRPILEDESVEVVMHGADFDLRLLDRDLDIRLRGLFDTQIAASLLGVAGLGLQSLLEERLAVSVSKRFQRADWARRPLPDEMKEYAAYDTIYLDRLANDLTRELEERGRLGWAREEFRELEGVRFEERENDDPVARVRAARDLAPREVARLREALEWRDEVARERDQAPFRVVGNGPLVEVARSGARTAGDLSNVQGLSGKLVQEHGEGLLAGLRSADSLPESEIEGYPRDESGGRGRPPPEVEARMAQLKQVRNSRANSLGIDRGTLLPNSTLQALAESPPTSPSELAQADGIRKWQAELLGEDLVGALRQTMATGT